MESPPGGRGIERARTIRARVTGRVQGVGFRWSCMDRALALGLVGEVSNRRDGTVEVCAQGPAADVAELVVWLYSGPRWASVDDVEVEDLPAGSLAARSFRIRS